MLIWQVFCFLYKMILRADKIYFSPVLEKNYNSTKNIGKWTLLKMIASRCLKITLWRKKWSWIFRAYQFSPIGFASTISWKRKEIEDSYKFPLKALFKTMFRGFGLNFSQFARFHDRFAGRLFLEHLSMANSAESLHVSKAALQREKVF